MKKLTRLPSGSRNRIDRQVLDRAAERGDIPATTDRSFVTAALMGPLYYRRWFAREPVDEQFIVALVRSVLDGFGDEIRQGV